MQDFYPNLNHPEKYNGKRPIHLRSKYEIDFARRLDNNNYVKFWNSEDIKIKYKFPYRLEGATIKKTKINKTRTYYMDFCYVTTDNKIRLVEIKNMDLTKKPVMKKNRKTYIYHVFQYEKNKAKWEEVERYLKLFPKLDIDFTVTSGYDYTI